MSSQPGWTAEGRRLVAGRAVGEALVLDEPLSFWGGLDVESGRIVDVRHPQHGESVVGRVVAMSAGRGSSSSSSVLAEAIRRRSAPAALLLSEPDEIVALGALVAELLDGLTCPVVVLAADDYRRLSSGDTVEVFSDGRLAVTPAQSRTWK